VALAAQTGWDLGPREKGPERYTAARAVLRKYARAETENPDGSFTYVEHRFAGIGDSTETVGFDGDFIEVLDYKQEHDIELLDPGGASHAAKRAGLGLRQAGKVRMKPPTYPLVHRGTGLLAGKGPDAMPAAKEKPALIPVWIVGPMTNTSYGNLRDDFWANGVMRSNLARGRARSGFFYRNVSEDEATAGRMTTSTGSPR